MRFRRLILIGLLLAGCGQPLQLNTPTGGTQQAPLGASTAQPARTASPVAAPSPLASAVASTATAVTLPSAMPSPLVLLPTEAPQTSEQRWRAQQLDRLVFEGQRIYAAGQPVSLLWYDPATGQSLEIGSLIGDFPAQAQFTLRGTGQPALEVPYRINTDFGLTAISAAVRERMRAAGYTESVEAYIVQTESVSAKQ